MLPRLDKLAAKAESLGLTVTPKGKKLGKQDYVDAFREYYLPEGGLPYEELTPMLCFAEWNLKPAEAEKAWKSPTWVAQRKLNGCRLVVHFVKGVGVFAHSRTVSVKTFRYEELTEQLLIKDFVPDFSATIDTEVLVEKSIDTTGYTTKGQVTKTSLHSTTAILHLESTNARKIQVDQDAALNFFVFDVTSFEGQDLRKKPLSYRLQVLNRFEAIIAKTEIGQYFQFPGVVNKDKRAFFEQIVEEGGEGVILKRLDSIYVDSSSRKRDAWVKVKRRQEYDAYVSGFKRGDVGTAWENLIGALEFSIMTDEGPHVIGFATNLSLESRKKISVYDPSTNKVSLLPAVYGKVGEISGQDISARELRLSHCTVDRWRPKTGPDAKTKDQCFVKMADLREAAEWVGS